MERMDHREALAVTGLLSKLRVFDPHVAGTPPLGLDLPDSDIDVLCHAPDPQAFTRVVWDAFAGHSMFSVRQWTGTDRPVIVSFAAAGWCFEVFGQAVPVSEQNGWRHFEVERRLLALGGDAFRLAVMARRRAGAKTEPAFAATLGLAGDPYQVVLDLAGWPEAALTELLARRGFGTVQGRGASVAEP